MMDRIDLKNAGRCTVENHKGHPFDGPVTSIDLTGLRKVKQASKHECKTYGPDAAPFVRCTITVRESEGVTSADVNLWNPATGIGRYAYETREERSTSINTRANHRDRAERWAIQFARSVGAKRLVMEDQ